MTQDHARPEAADDSSAASAVPSRSSADGGGPVHALGTEWRRGDDGLLFREAARVILLDEDDRVLLIRGHDADQPDRSWWFTVGGGIDDGEDALGAAVREVREETGILLDPGQLVGPVFTRSAIFDFFAEHCRQDEILYLARVPASAFESVDRAGWTDLELDVIDELRWWSLDDLDLVELEVFPDRLVDLVRGLLPVWDGVTRHLGLARE